MTALLFIFRNLGRFKGRFLWVYFVSFIDGFAIFLIPVLQRYHSGYILSLINKIADTMPQMMFDFFATLARGSSVFLCFFFFTARESLLMAFVNAGILTLFIGISFLLSRRIVPLVQALNKHRAGLMATVADFAANILTIKKLSIFRFANTELQRQSVENDTHIRRLQNFHANRWSILHIIFGTAFMGTIAFLLYQTVYGFQSASILILFIAGFVHIKNVVERMSETFKNFMDMKAYIHDLEAILGTSKKQKGKHIKTWQRILLENVRFQHDNNHKSIQIPSFVVEPGDIILVTGTSGQGKSTMLNLLANFLKADGNLFVNKTPYAEVDPAFFEENMGFISQETELFSMSLKRNITLDKEVPEKQLRHLLERLHLAEWVDSLEHGLDTMVGEKGVVLSAGQKQRVNLLRGVLLERDIYLMDEPTSHLDHETESAVVDLLREHLQGKTAIIVSHRDALFPLATKHYRMEHHVLTQVSPSDQ